MRFRIKKVRILYRWTFRDSTAPSVRISAFATPIRPCAAIADGVEEAVEEKLGEKVWRVEGKQTGLWVAMDYMDVVVHIFTTELRSFYKLEELWADAPLKRYDYEE